MKKTGIFLSLALALCLGGIAAAADGYDPDLVPNRLSYAKVGEWVDYSLPNGYTQKLTVTKRTDADAYGTGMVTVRVENIYEGEVTESKEITQEAGEPYSAPQVPSTPGVTVALRQEIGDMKGRPVAVSVVEINTYSDDPDETKSVEYWITPDVPVFGILKKVENGETEWELADWGEE